MYCPRCGSELKEIKRTPPREIDWYEDKGEELDNLIELHAAFDMVEREEYECTKGCFQKDFPLYFHHPFRGIDSRPGDSWSLSWVK
jgi:hypothetical protein